MRNPAYQLFLEEAQELLIILEEGLLLLHEQCETAQVHELMRAAHTIKGGASMVGISSITAIAHRLEDVFRGLYCQDLKIDKTLETLLLQAYDCLEAPILQEIETGSHDEGAVMAAAEPVLAQLEAKLGPLLSTLELDVSLPEMSEFGLDMVQLLFSGDVAEGLKHIEESLKISDPITLGKALRIQVETFAGIGELTSLPGFVNLAQTTLDALALHPQQARDIGQVALTDFQSAQQAVLSGERSQGGIPSPALQRFTQSRISTADKGADWESESDLDLDLDLGPDSAPDSAPDSDIAIDFALEADPGGLSPVDPPNQDSLFEIDSSTERSIPSLASASLSLPEEADLESGLWHDATTEEEILLGLFGEEEPLVAAETEINNLDATDCAPSNQELDDLAGDLNLADLEQEPLISPTPSEQLPPPELSLFDTDIDLVPASVELSGDWSPEDLVPEDLSVNSSVDELTIDVPPTTDLDISEQSKPTEATQEGSLPTVSAESIKPKTAAKTPTKTVRVSLDRLKRLNNLFGELVTHENKSTLQAQQLQSVIGSMTLRFSNFERITRNLQDWADQSHHDHAKLSSPHPSDSSLEKPSTPSLQPMSEGRSNFDPLQLDTYGYLYTLAQEVMEEIAQLDETIRDMTAITQQGQQVYRQKQQTLRHIRNDLIRTSMLSLGDLLRHFPRMVREMSNRYGKQVTVEVQGGDTLVDRTVFEKLYDPLVHLVRNAFDHGIEPPELRSHLGKPEKATILLKAYHKGHQTYLEISDDGRGINVEAIRTKAVERSLYTPEEASNLTRDQLYSCLFMPGFSTAPSVSELSGRGVGLDAVDNQVKQLKGSISVISEPHKGTTFTLRFPLTLNIAELIVFTISNRMLALSMDSVEAIISVPLDDIETQQGAPAFCWNGDSVPLYSKASLLRHYPLRGNHRDALPAIPLPKDGQVPMVIITNGQQRVALQVDSILQAQELTIKPFGIAVQAPSYLCGCTTLGDGSMIPVIDGQALLVRYQNTQSSPSAERAMACGLANQRLKTPLPKKASPLSSVDAAGLNVLLSEGIAPNDTAVENSGEGAHQPLDNLLPEMPTVLVVDDSLTARHVLVFTLEKAGYPTLQAKDGREALSQLKQNFAEIQAVFCDVEMPKMNGFEFLSQCHQEYGDKAPPVIMLTSRSGEKHRQMGAELGASAYLTKPYLEQALLNTLQTCLTDPPETQTSQNLSDPESSDQNQDLSKTPASV